MVECVQSVCDAQPTKCTSELSHSDTFTIWLLVLVPILTSLIGPPLSNRMQRLSGGKEVDVMVCCGLYSFTYLRTGLMPLYCVLLFGVFGVFLPYLHEQRQPCNTPLGGCGTISCVAGSYNPEGYVLLLLLITLICFVVVKEAANIEVAQHNRGFAHKHSRTRVFMTSAACLLLLTGIFPERYANDVTNVAFADRTVDRHRIHYFLHMGGVCSAVAVLVGLPFFWALFITGSEGDAKLDEDSISGSARALIRRMSVRLSVALTRHASRRRVSCDSEVPQAPAATGEPRVPSAALGLSRPLVWARVVHVSVLLVYTGCFFLLVEHADTSDYCFMLQREHAHRSLAHTAQLADACARWPKPANTTTASACTAFSDDVLPSYTCRYVTFTLSAAEARLVDFGLGLGVRERGACRKHSCLIFQNARSVALEFGLLLLSFTYYASYGLNDLQRLFNAKASMREAFHERVRSVADTLPA